MRAGLSVAKEGGAAMGSARVMTTWTRLPGRVTKLMSRSSLAQSAPDQPAKTMVSQVSIRRVCCVMDDMKLS